MSGVKFLLNTDYGKEPKVVSGDYQPDFLAVVFQASQPCAAGSTRFADVGETPFDTLATQLLKLFVTVAIQSSSVGSVGGFVFSRLVCPATMRTVRFADAGSQLFSQALRECLVLMVTLVGDGFFDLRVAVRFLKVALSGADTVQQRVRVRFVAVIDLGGNDRFSLQVDRMFLPVRQVRVAFLHLHHTSIRVARTFPLLVGCLLAFALPVELPQGVIAVDLDAFSVGEPLDVRFPVLASILAIRSTSSPRWPPAVSSQRPRSSFSADRALPPGTART
jgi:hypothetical protein